MSKTLPSLLVVFIVSSLTGCLESFDPKAEEHFYQGIEFSRQHNRELALEEFTQAIELDPGYYYAYYNHALVNYQLGNLESSLADYNKAIELLPDNPYWTLERGFLYLELGDRERAIIDLEKSLELGLPHDLRRRAEEALIDLRP